VQGRVIGAMNVQTAETHDFASDDVELLALIANLAAGALEKAALYDRMQQQIQELSTLAEVSRTVTSPLYLDEMLGVVTEMAARVMGAKASSLHLLDDASGRLLLRAAHNIGSTAEEFSSIAVGNGIAGRVAAGGKPIVVADVRADDRYLNRALAQAEGWVSLVAVPLIVRGRVAGVFGCFTGTFHEFTAQEVELCQTLANQTALAIENAQLVINRAVVSEMHHRVKNNLQSIAMLLRLQMSAARNLRAEDVLAETATRILSIAAVHENLSEQGLRVVHVKSVLERVTRSIGEMLETGGRGIAIAVTGDSLVLPSREATSLALATSELVQNAVKHAFPGRDHGRVAVGLRLGPGESEVVVEDDGVGTAGAPDSAGGLGLQLVETLVRDDLKGRFALSGSAAGTRVVIRFPGGAGAGAKP